MSEIECSVHDFMGGLRVDLFVNGVHLMNILLEKKRILFGIIST